MTRPTVSLAARLAAPTPPGVVRPPSRAGVRRPPVPPVRAAATLHLTRRALRSARRGVRRTPDRVLHVLAYAALHIVPPVAGLTFVFALGAAFAAIALSPGGVR